MFVDILMIVHEIREISKFCGSDINPLDPVIKFQTWNGKVLLLIFCNRGGIRFERIYINVRKIHSEIKLQEL